MEAYPYLFVPNRRAHKDAHTHARVHFHEYDSVESREFQSIRTHRDVGNVQKRRGRSWQPHQRTRRTKRMSSKRSRPSVISPDDHGKHKTVYADWAVPSIIVKPWFLGTLDLSVALFVLDITLPYRSNRGDRECGVQLASRSRSTFPIDATVYIACGGRRDLADRLGRNATRVFDPEYSLVSSSSVGLLRRRETNPASSTNCFVIAWDAVPFPAIPLSEYTLGSLNWRLRFLSGHWRFLLICHPSVCAGVCVCAQ